MSGQMGNTLLVTSVGREDKGMYQCMVRRQEGDTFQAVAELQLGGECQACVLYVAGMVGYVEYVGKSEIRFRCPTSSASLSWRLGRNPSRRWWQPKATIFSHFV